MSQNASNRVEAAYKGSQTRCRYHLYTVNFLLLVPPPRSIVSPTFEMVAPLMLLMTTDFGALPRVRRLSN